MWNLHRLFHYLAGNEKCRDVYKGLTCDRNKGHWGNHWDDLHEVGWYRKYHPILQRWVKFRTMGPELMPVGEEHDHAAGH